jgi:hypothetical protein
MSTESYDFSECCNQVAQQPDLVAERATNVKAGRSLADRKNVAVCRLCGETCLEEDLRPVQEGGGCSQCNGSPACSRCGHARRQHRGTFSGGLPGCTARVPVEHSLAVGRCGCEAYTRERDAFEEHTPIVDVVTPQLRVWQS